MRTDFDSFFGHHERAIQQSEIADGTTAFCPNRKRAAAVDRDVIAEDDSAGRFAFEKAKDLRAFAIKAFSENNVGRNWFLPPIVFDVPVALDVAHDGSLPDA